MPFHSHRRARSLPTVVKQVLCEHCHYHDVVFFATSFTAPDALTCGVSHTEVVIGRLEMSAIADADITEPTNETSRPQHAWAICQTMWLP